MQQLRILNSKEIKHIQQFLQEQFNAHVPEGYAYFQNNDNKVFLVNRDIAKLRIEHLILDKIGLYLGELQQHEFRLSKEGAQFVALHNSQLTNLVSLAEEEVKEYFQGLDLAKDRGGKSRFVLLQHQDQVFCCAKYKQGKILNFLPKAHRGEVIL